VTCVAINVELDVSVSGSKVIISEIESAVYQDGTCIIHTIRQGIYVSSIYHPSKSSITLVAISEQLGHILIYLRENLSLNRWFREDGYCPETLQVPQPSPFFLFFCDFFLFFCFRLLNSLFLFFVLFCFCFCCFFCFVSVSFLFLFLFPVWRPFLRFQQRAK